MDTTRNNVQIVEQGPYTGIYTIPDAALYLRTTAPAPVTPIRGRSSHRRPFVVPSSRHLYAWMRRSPEWHNLTNVPGNRLVINFAELIRLRMIAIMRSRGLPFDAILRAEDVARELTKSQEPFISEEMWTSSSDIFLQVERVLISATRGGQTVMEFFRDYLVPVKHGLTFGPGAVVATWQPAPLISIDPQIQSGAPCIAGTRIQTEVIWALHQAGDPVDVLAEMYRVRQGQIEAAIAWERSLAAAAA